VVYTVTGDTVGLAIGPVSEAAIGVHEALSKARLMYEDGMANVSIKNETGQIIEGDKLLDCITGKRNITEDFDGV
jgi:hypothetical protein